MLLILAGTAISISINGGDLFGKTADARNSWNSAVAREENAINEVWNILNGMTGGNGGGGNPTATSEGTATPTPTPAGLTVPTEFAPGDTVTWTPNGKYTEWKANYYSDDDTIDKVLYSGNTAQKESVTTTTSWDAATDGNHNIDMTISSWKVLDVSNDRKTVRLVPSAPTTAEIKLRGAQGYNNAVKLLNDACDALYGGAAGSADGITARSISMVDIEGAMTTTEALTTAKANYGTRKTSAYTVANSKYPKIYEEEALRKINGTESTIGIGMSEEATIGLDTNGFIPRVNGARNIVEDAIIQPAHTYYYLNNANFAAALGYPANGYAGTNGPFLPNGSSTRNYWVASRFVFTSDRNCYFNVRSVYSGSLIYCNMFYSYDYASNDALSLFPVVSLSSGVLSRIRPCIHICTSFVGRSKKSREKKGASPAQRGRTGPEPWAYWGRFYIGAFINIGDLSLRIRRIKLFCQAYSRIYV